MIGWVNDDRCLWIMRVNQRKGEKDSRKGITILGLNDDCPWWPIRQLGPGLALVGSRNNDELMLSQPQQIRASKRMLQHGSRANESTVLFRNWLAHSLKDAR